MSSVNSINKRLKEARISLGLKQSEIADDLGIKQKSISEIENGHIQNIPNTYIYYFFKKTISLEWIYENAGEMFISNKNIEKKGEEPTKIEHKKTLKTSSLSDLFKDKKKDTNFETKEGRGNDHFYERIISSKDFSIQTLLKLVEHQESTIELLKKT